MSILEDLAKLSAAEEFFAFLDVPFDPKVIQVARLHILRRMAQYLKGSEIEGAFDVRSDADIRALCRSHLERAYKDFLASTPIQERLFKVHREAMEQKAEPQKPFIPLAALLPVQNGH
jgi:nitrogenase-stabilizing/protective protein